MAPSRADIEGRFVALLQGDQSRDEVDRWAEQWCTVGEQEVDDDVAWWALELLFGIDLREGPQAPYLHSDEQVAGWLAEFRSRCDSS